MHEFLCSETQPTMPLSLADLKTPPGKIYVNNIFLTVCPSDFVYNSHNVIECCCKLKSSLLDVICGSVGAKGVKQVGMSEDSLASNTLSLVDASTCLLKCNRCQSILGDGCIADDSLYGKKDNNCNESQEQEKIELSDLQDLRFLKSEVSWYQQSNNTPTNILDPQQANISQLLTLNSLPEQMITNTFLWLVNRYDLTSFELYVPDWTDTTLRFILHFYCFLVFILFNLLYLLEL